MQEKTKQDLNFSPEEWAVIIGFSSRQAGAVSRLGWYSSILGPIALFCAYGAWKGEIAAVGLAFVCLLACKIWLIVVELRHLNVYCSIFGKIVEFKRSQDTDASPGASS